MKKLSILLIMLLSACATGETRIKTFDQNSPVSVNPNFDDKNVPVVIKVRGEIEQKTQDDLQTIMHDVISSGRKTFTIELNSPGGDQEATDMISAMFYMLRKEVKNVNITTLVKNGTECNSGCGVLFALGNKRVAERNAMFVFHYGSGHGNAKYFNNINTFKQIINLCGSENKITNAILDDKNKPLILKAEDVKKTCPAYITELK